MDFTRIEEIEINAVKTGPPFRDLFPREEALIAQIQANMETIGYDKAAPMVVWRQKDVLIDGHQRLEAARRAGLGTVWVCYWGLPDEYQAVNYALREQGSRRNLTDWNIYFAVKALDNRKKHGGKRGKKKVTDVNSVSSAQLCTCSLEEKSQERERLAGLLNTNRNKIQQCLTLVDHELTDREIGLIKRKSIRAAYIAFRDRKEREALAQYDSLEEDLDWKEPGRYYAFHDGSFLWAKKEQKRPVDAVTINPAAFPSEEDYLDCREAMKCLIEVRIKRWAKAKELARLKEIDEGEGQIGFYFKKDTEKDGGK